MKMRRRHLLQIVASLPAFSGAAAAVGCGGRPPLQFLDADERAKLAHLADLVIPPDDAPGGNDLGVVEYIDRFLSGDGIFFASGPFSGRTPFPDAEGRATGVFPPDKFLEAEPLDRVQHAAAKELLFGSDRDDGSGGAAGDGGNGGPSGSKGLRALFRENLKGVGVGTTLDDLDEDFLDALVQLVCEGAFAAPEYGGNRDMNGWRFVHYEGDLMPFGFTTFDEVRGVYRERPGASTSAKDDTLDPEPIDADVETFLSTAIELLGGRDTKASR